MENDSKKISIIIPVYNVEKYLDRCLESVVNQSYKNLEIILVDDGSPDSSGAMCDSWAKKDDRIKVIHKENGGLGLARNSGLDEVTGDYITFLDSDDYLDLETCELSLKRLLEFDADMCYYGEKYVYTSGKVKENSYSFLEDVYEKDKLERIFLANTIAPGKINGGAPAIGMSAGKILCKASIINDNHIRFMSERKVISEDLVFRIELCLASNRVTSLHKCFYYYCQNNSSLSKSYNKERFNSSKRMHKTIYELCKKSNNKDLLLERCDRMFLCDTVVAIKFEVENEKTLGKAKIKENIKNMLSDEELKAVLNSYPIDRLPISTKTMYYAMKHNMVNLIYILSVLKLKKEKKEQNI